MLPFIKKEYPLISTAIVKRKPDGSTESDGNETKNSEELKTCAEDLLRGINTKNINTIAEAIRSAFEILDSAPHIEGEHLNEE